MKLKTLLLGSAAAMVAVSGAHAADAVIAAEPEAVEYVRVCDLYSGGGFFYIPGTETCLKLSGSMRIQYEWNENGTAAGVVSASPATTRLVTVPTTTATAGVAGTVLANGNVVVGQIPAGTAGTTGAQTVLATQTAAIAAAPGRERSAASATYRARVNFDARNETDFGTLRSFVRLEGNGSDEAAGSVVVQTAVTSLGGLSFGYGDTFFTTNTEYGHLGNMLDGTYDYDQSIFMQYTFAAGGFSATAGIQGGNEADDRQIDPYFGASYSNDLFKVAGTVIYDADVEEVAYSGAVIVRPITGLAIKGWYQGDDGGRIVNAATGLAVPTGNNTQYVDALGEYQWGIGGSYAVLDNFAIGLGYSQADDTREEFVAGFSWKPVSGLNVQFDYRHQDFEFGAFKNGGVTNDENTYRIRITRSW